MTIYKSIIAWCSNSGIGLKGKMPWCVKKDLARFAKITKGGGHNAVIMGKNTWAGLPVRALPGRLNIVLSRRPRPPTAPKDVVFVTSLTEAQRVCEEHGIVEGWVIGGAEVYRQAVEADMLDSIEATEIEGEHDCDTFVPMEMATFLAERMYRLIVIPFQETNESTGVEMKGTFVSYRRES